MFGENSVITGTRVKWKQRNPNSLRAEFPKSRNSSNYRGIMFLGNNSRCFYFQLTPDVRVNTFSGKGFNFRKCHVDHVAGGFSGVIRGKIFLLTSWRCQNFLNFLELLPNKYFQIRRKYFFNWWFFKLIIDIFKLFFNRKIVWRCRNSTNLII